MVRHIFWINVNKLESVDEFYALVYLEQYSNIDKNINMFKTYVRL